MRTVIVNDSKKADCDRFVASTPGVISWHQYDWRDVLDRFYGLQYYPVAVYDGAAICGILPLYLARTLRAGRALISIPYVVAGGIVAADEAVQQMLLQKAIALCKLTNSTHIVLKQYKLKIGGELRTDEGYYNRELALSRNVDDVWKAISKANRERIEETWKCDIALDYPSQDMNGFYSLLFANQHAIGLPCVSRRWIECLVGAQMYRIALLKHKGTIVAGTLVKQFKDTVSFPFTSLPDQDERSMLFAFNLYWKLISQLAVEGVHIFHSGRIPLGELAPEYRLGWGGAKCYYYYQYYGSHGGKRKAGTPGRGRMRKVFEMVWKKIPRSLAAAIGPSIVRQFP